MVTRHATSDLPAIDTGFLSLCRNDSGRSTYYTAVVAYDCTTGLGDTCCWLTSCGGDTPPAVARPLPQTARTDGRS